MNKEAQPVDRGALSKGASRVIHEYEGALVGVETAGVTQRSGMLVFTSDYFLNEQGSPTVKGIAVFNMFKHLAHMLSEKYHLAD